MRMSVLQRSRSLPSLKDWPKYLCSRLKVPVIFLKAVLNILSIFAAYPQTAFINNISNMLQFLVQFYSQPEIILHRSRTSSKSLTSQISFPEKALPEHLKPQNFYDPLFEDIDDNMTTMDIDNQDPSNKTTTTVMSSQNIVISSWNTDASITALSENLFSHMQDCKKFTEETGESEDIAPDHQKPIPIIGAKCNQQIRFNLIHHRGAVADIPVLKLFKSFTSTLKKADSSVIIHPFQASKQHYSSLST